MIKIDDKEYDLDTLSVEAKNQVASLRFVNAELASLFTGSMESFEFFRVFRGQLLFLG